MPKPHTRSFWVRIQTSILGNPTVIKTWSFVLALSIFMAVGIADVIADGKSYLIDESTAAMSVADELGQTGVIALNGGIETLVIGITTGLRKERGIWIFPIPAAPDRISMQVLHSIPRFEKYEFEIKTDFGAPSCISFHLNTRAQ